MNRRQQRAMFAKMGNTSKTSIFRIGIADQKGKFIGIKLVDAKSRKAILQQPKSKFVGRGRKIVFVQPTRLKGKVAERRQLPVARRFGKV